MTPFALQPESPGHAADRRRARRRVSAYIAQTWKHWYTWGLFLGDEPNWSGPGMIWRHRGRYGKVLFGIN